MSLELIAPCTQDLPNQRGWKLACVKQNRPFLNHLIPALREKIKPITPELFLIEERASFQILSQLIVKQAIQYQGKMVHSDLFTSSRLIHELQKEGSQYTLRAKLFVGKTSFYLDEASVSSIGRWAIYQHFFYPLPEDADRQAILTQKITVENNIALAWIRNPSSYEEADELLIENLLSDQEKSAPLLEKPILQLLDMTLCRAKLSWHKGSSVQTYEGQKELNDVSFIGDLKELGANWSSQKKHFVWEHPQQAHEALELLMEMGWQVLSSLGHPLKKMTKLHVEELESLQEGMNGYQAKGYVEVENPSHASQNEPQRLSLGPLAHHLKRALKLIPLGSQEYLLAPFRLNATLQSILQAEPQGEGLKWHPWQATLAAELKPQTQNLQLHQWQTLQQLAREKSAPADATLPSTYGEITLREYQKQAVRWMRQLESMKLGGLLADEMGLGKTIQILAFLVLQKTSFPHLIVVPRSLLTQWSQEIVRFYGQQALGLYHGPKRQLLLNASVWLTTYQTLVSDVEGLSVKRWQTVIFDESHLIRNPKSQGYEAAQKLVANMKLAVTGTPIFNSANDLWTQMKLVSPSLFSTQTAQDSLSEEANFKAFSPLWMRRTKKEVASELPEKMEQVIWLDMDENQSELYKKVLQAQIKATQEGQLTPMKILEKILRLRQCCLLPQLVEPGYEGLGVKQEQLLQDLDILLSEGQSVLVFSQFSQVLRALFESASTDERVCHYIDAKTPHREGVIESFVKGPTSALFLTLGVGSVGLNLTRASAVILLDPWWNEAVENQAIDRTHRLGQKKGVSVFRYLIKSSLEEAMMEIKKNKSLQVEAWIQSEEGSETKISSHDNELWQYLQLQQGSFD